MNIYTHTNAQQDICLPNSQDNPSDIVSDLQWSPNLDSIFALSSLDGTIQIYQVDPQRKILQKIQALKHSESIVRIAWKQDSSIIFASTDSHLIIAFQIQSGQIAQLGKHDDIISYLVWIDHLNALFSFSYDSTIKAWDLNGQLRFNITCTSQIHAACIVKNLCIFTSFDKIFSMNISFIEKYQNIKLHKYDCFAAESDIISIAISNDLNDVLLGTVDSRCIIVNVKTQSSSYDFTLNKNIIFRTHKQDDRNMTFLYQISSVGFFNNSLQQFFTSGGDGMINIWDSVIILYKKKQKIKEIKKEYPIVIARFNDKTKQLAYILGYDWSQGVWGLEKIQQSIVQVYQINENDQQQFTNQSNNLMGTSRQFFVQ